MTRVFSARNDAEAELVCAALAAEGIPARVEGRSLAGGVQILGDTLPTVWVEDADAGRAAGIIEALPHGGGTGPADEPDDATAADAADAKAWTCPRCGQRVADTFDACWKCTTLRPDRQDA